MKAQILKPLIILLMLPAVLFAQSEKKKTETIYIQTSAICESCKETIEHAVKGVKGVKKANLNLSDKKVMVVFKMNQASVDQIKTAISKAGYDADEVKADPKAYADLPLCCKKDSK